MSRHRGAPIMRRSSALAAIAGGVLAASERASAQSDAPVVRIGAIAIDAFGEAYYGSDREIFLQNGITPQVTTLTNGSSIIQATLGGDLDVGMSNTIQVAAAIARGIPLQMLAPASLYSARDAGLDLAVAKASPFKSAKDLTGGTVAVSTLRDFNQLGVEAWLDRNGVPRAGVQFVELPFAEMGAALTRGTVQAAMITEPSKTKAMRAGEIRPFADVYSAVSPEFATVVWFSTKTWLQKNPDVAKKLVSGIYATARWANSHLQQSGEIIAKVAKMESSTVAVMRRVYFATANDKKYVEGPLELASRYGIIQRPVTVSEFTAALG